MINPLVIIDTLTKVQKLGLAFRGLILAEFESSIFDEVKDKF